MAKGDPTVKLRALGFYVYVPPGCSVELEGVGLNGPFSYKGNTDAGFGVVFPEVDMAITLANLHVHANGYKPWNFPSDGEQISIPGARPDGETNWLFFVGTWPNPLPPDVSIQLTPDMVPALPTVPTRAEVCSGKTSGMQGLFLQTNQFGLMPWWDACLAWCNPETRQLAYAAKHANGDTHCLIELPDGKPLYNEIRQFYDPVRFGPLDATSGFSNIAPWFIELVQEVVNNGFKFVIFLDEVEADSFKCLPLIMNALKTNNLYKYGYVMPGWDGVFYVWPNESIVNWARQARSIIPDCYLGLEQPVGHIPLGEGGSDYAVPGRMNDYDVILGEFEMDKPHDDNVWQICARMSRPYNRPPDQPAGDDPNPPFYLWPSSPRGVYYYWLFELLTYPFVRVDVNNPNVVNAFVTLTRNQRAYLKGISPAASLC